MPKPTSRLRDMEIDEVSVVDKGAAADALIAIAKRATQEVTMPNYTYEDGSPVIEDKLEEGDIVFDEAGNAFEYVLEDEVVEPEQTTVEDPELEPVGKSAFPSFTDEVREEIAKAFTGGNADASRELFSKAAAEIDSLRKQLGQVTEVAKSEKAARLTEAYISKAASYNVPVDANELGPVLYRMAETMSFEDCSVINKCLTAAGATIFQEIGNVGGGDNKDILTQVSKAAEAGGIDATEVFDNNPDAYAEYVHGQR